MVWGRHPSPAPWKERSDPPHSACTPELRFAPRFLQSLLREAKAGGVLVKR